MKIRVLCFSLIALVASSDVVLADTLPKRKPGLWELSVTASGDGQPHVSKQCVDEATDAKLQSMLQQGLTKDSCSKNEFTKTATGFESHAECTVGPAKVTSVGSFSGDFNSSYTGEVVTTFEPPMVGNGRSTVSMSAKWSGPCPADMKPGDIVTEHGKFDMDQAAAGMRQAQEMMKNPEFAKMMREGLRQANQAGALGAE
jgi:hypothetical protein